MNRKFLKFHHVKKSETLSHIAVRYGTTTRELMKLNKHINNKNLIYEDEYLIVGYTRELERK